MSALARLRESFPQCELPGCRRRTVSWRMMGRGGEGIRMAGRWYCSAGCFEAAIAEVYQGQLPAMRKRQTKRHRVPLGLVLFSLGMVTQDSLKTALQAQKQAGTGRIGEWLMQAGVVDENQVTTAVAMQWSCPVFPLESHRRFLDCAQLVPLPLLEAARMVPVHHLPASSFLYVAFAESIDYTTLYGVEQMLEVRTEPCLAAESSIDRALDELRQEPRPMEFLFDTGDPAEMAAATRNCAIKMNAEDARVVSCGTFIWTRLESHTQIGNLLFQVMPRP